MSIQFFDLLETIDIEASDACVKIDSLVAEWRPGRKLLESVMKSNPKRKVFEFLDKVDELFTANPDLGTVFPRIRRLLSVYRLVRRLLNVK